MALLVFIALYAILTTVGVPMVVMTFDAGFTFGAMWGTLYVLVGANIGASLAFDLARYLGRDFISRYIKGPIDRIDRQLRNQGFLRMLQLRLIPLIPFNLLNLAAGLSGIRKIHYVLGTMIGITPSTFIYAYTAASLMQSTWPAQNSTTWRRPLEPPPDQPGNRPRPADHHFPDSGDLQEIDEGLHR